MKIRAHYIYNGLPYNIVEDGWESIAEYKAELKYRFKHVFPEGTYKFGKFKRLSGEYVTPSKVVMLLKVARQKIVNSKRLSHQAYQTIDEDGSKCYCTIGALISTIDPNFSNGLSPTSIMRSPEYVCTIPFLTKAFGVANVVDIVAINDTINKNTAIKFFDKAIELAKAKVA